MPFRDDAEFATVSSVAHPVGDEAAGETDNAVGHVVARPTKEGPDPVIGAGITLLGIFLMGTGGAGDAHYVFDAGVALGLLGAGIFVLSVALSVMKQDAAPHAEPRG